MLIIPLHLYNMFDYNKIEPIGFIDQFGWQENEEPNSSFINPHKNLLKKLESKSLTRQKYKSHHSRYEKLEPIKSNGHRIFRKQIEVKECNIKLPQQPRCCILQSIDLATNKNRIKYRSIVGTKDILNPNSVNSNHQQHLIEEIREKKVSLPSQFSLLSIKRPIRIERIIHLEPKDPLKIDNVTSKYLKEYYTERKRQKVGLKKVSRIFQIPLFNSLDL